MSINVKKYTKDQMAKMVEEAQAEAAALEAEIVELHEHLAISNKAAIDESEEYRENTTKLKADADVLRNKLADTEAALGRANAEVSRLTVGGRQVEEERDYMHQQWSNAEQRANYAEAHPWRNLWAWVKRKLVRHE